MSDFGDWGWMGHKDRSLEFPVGDNVGVAPRGRARIRFNRTLGRYEQSIDGAAYTIFGGTGICGVPTGRTAWVDSVNGDDATGVAGDLTTPFLTIAAAIAAISALVPAPAAATPATVLVEPGVYQEAALTIPSYVTLVSTGRGCVTKITPTVATATVVTGSPLSGINGFVISGASGVGGIGIRHQAAGGAFNVKNCRIADCETGLSVSGAGSITIIESVTIKRSTGETMDTAILVESGGALVGNILSAIGTVGTLLTHAIKATGANSLCALHNVHLGLTTNGVTVANTATVTIHSGVAARCVNSLRIEATSGELRAFNVEVTASTTNDVLIETAAATFIFGNCQFDISKLSITAGATINGTYLNTFESDEGFDIEGELHVGNYLRPAESVFGGGDSHVIGMVALRNTNQEAGAWSDITTELKSPSGSTAALFPGVTANNTFYIGGDVEFPGLKVSLDTIMTLGAGTVVAEFWDGAAWTEFTWMTTDSDSPYASYADALFNETTSLQMRFGTMTSWATKSLDGNTKYWVRFRVTVGITTSPIGEQMKLHTNRTEINSDGFVEFFGAARQQRQLPFHRNLLDDQVGSAPGNSTIDVSANIEIGAKDNRFANNAVDARAAMVEVPSGLDTSLPVTVTLYWATPGNAGNIEWFIVRAPVKVGDVLGGALSEAIQAQLQAVPGVANTLAATSLSMPVNSLLAGEFLTLKIERDATGGNLDDTLANLAYLVNVRLLGWFWN